MRFLAFEGLDGSGKSTLISGLKKEFETRGQKCVLTREPGGTSLGTEIRQLLLRNEGEAPVARAEALLYQADRAQHVETLIKPALKRGEWVLSDRFAASSIAFQTGGRALDVSAIEWLNRFSTDDLKPDMYVLLDLSVEESLKRMAGRAQEADRFEREGKDFHEKVRQAYLKLAKEEPSRWLILSAEMPSAKMLETLIQDLKAKKWLV